MAVLDYMSDTVCCLYGEPGAYGVVTKIASVRNGINNFLAGYVRWPSSSHFTSTQSIASTLHVLGCRYIPAENMRFRAEELSFVVSGAETADQMAAEGGIGKVLIKPAL